MKRRDYSERAISVEQNNVQDHGFTEGRPIGRLEFDEKGNPYNVISVSVSSFTIPRSRNTERVE